MMTVMRMMVMMMMMMKMMIVAPFSAERLILEVNQSRRFQETYPKISSSVSHLKIQVGGEEGGEEVKGRTPTTPSFSLLTNMMNIPRSYGYFSSSGAFELAWLLRHLDRDRMAAIEMFDLIQFSFILFCLSAVFYQMGMRAGFCCDFGKVTASTHAILAGFSKRQRDFLVSELQSFLFDFLLEFI